MLINKMGNRIYTRVFKLIVKNQLKKLTVTSIGIVVHS